MSKIPDELKKQIQLLSPIEKDKLLLRLIAKEPLLIKKLEFELLEDKSTIDTRVQTLEAFIVREINSNKDSFTPGYLLMSLRSCSGSITEHVKITKDKYSEVWLNLWMINQAFGTFNQDLKRFNKHRCETFTLYVVKKMLQIIPKAEKLHEDLQYELKKPMQKALDYIFAFEHTAIVASHSGLRPKSTI